MASAAEVAVPPAQNHVVPTLSLTFCLAAVALYVSASCGSAARMALLSTAHDRSVFLLVVCTSPGVKAVKISSGRCATRGSSTTTSPATAHSTRRSLTRMCMLRLL